MLAAVQTQAQTVSTTGSTVITTAVPFLQINPVIRSGGMGDAGVALKQGPFASYLNPATLAFEESDGGLGLAFTPWLSNIIPDINHYYATGFYNLGGTRGVIGGALTFFSLGEIEFRDNNGIETGNFNANELALSVNYARKITENLSLGGSLRYIRSDLAGAQNLGDVSLNPGQSVAGDLALFHTRLYDGKTPVTFNWAFNISNIGAKMNYTGNSNNRQFLPTNLRLGAAAEIQLDEVNLVTLVGDVNKLMVPSQPDTGDQQTPLIEGIFSSFGDAEGGFSEELQEFTVSTGVEYTYNQLFSARLGYFWEDPTKGDRRYITFGAGVEYMGFLIDFAYLQPFQQQHPLVNTFRISLGYQFNKLN